MKQNLIFILLLTISSLSLAGTAAYFSIFGLSKLFYSAGVGIVILASVLELSKLVAVSYVYRYWKYIARALRAYYVFGVLFIMLLTSIGIYGFLTSAYQSTANKVEIRDSQINIAENKKSLFIAQLDRINKSIESKDKRISVLTENRNLQEQRLSELYGQNRITSARRTESQITGAEEQSKVLYESISDEMRQANAVNDSISYYDQKILELKSSDVSSEIGPLKYLSDLTGYSMNRVVNILVLLIIFVFDPMAITLLIGVNQLSMMGRKRDEDEIIEEKKEKNYISKIRNIFKKNSTPDENKIEKNKIDNKKIYYEKETNNNHIEDFNIFHRNYYQDDFEVGCPDGYVEKYIDIDPSKIKIGQRVFHNSFGKGVINKIDKNDTSRIFIKFENGDTKELNVEYAKLKIIECVENKQYETIFDDESIEFDNIDKIEDDENIVVENDINEIEKNENVINDVIEQPQDNIVSQDNIKIENEIVDSQDKNENIDSNTNDEKKNFYLKLKNLLKRKK